MRKKVHTLSIYFSFCQWHLCIYSRSPFDAEVITLINLLFVGTSTLTLNVGYHNLLCSNVRNYHHIIFSEGATKEVLYLFYVSCQWHLCIYSPNPNKTVPVITFINLLFVGTSTISLNMHYHNLLCSNARYNHHIIFSECVKKMHLQKWSNNVNHNECDVMFLKKSHKESFKLIINVELQLLCNNTPRTFLSNLGRW